ncbi:hypothetical protein J2Z23_003728, partial [Lederbergia galactosidilyticus]|nr:hypothetical protein [Lederbergia galactosidilytica]
GVTAIGRKLNIYEILRMREYSRENLSLLKEEET